MSDQTQSDVVKQTILATVEALAPTIIAASAAGANPAAAAMIPSVVNLMNAALQARNAGALSDQGLQDLFAATGKSIQTTHDKWLALNAQEAAQP